MRIRSQILTNYYGTKSGSGRTINLRILQIQIQSTASSLPLSSPSFFAILETPRANPDKNSQLESNMCKGEVVCTVYTPGWFTQIYQWDSWYIEPNNDNLVLFSYDKPLSFSLPFGTGGILFSYSLPTLLEKQ
jgi:hypothetical protein